MSLNKALGLALDRIVAGSPDFARFERLKVSGPELRNWWADDGRLQRQLLFYRDKWWSAAEGGVLYAELYCLVQPLQLALAGKPQSLARPDWAVPFHSFQFALSAAEVERGWELRSLADVQAAESSMSRWLAEVAPAWFRGFESDESVMDYMARHGAYLDLALWHQSRGEDLVARGWMQSWLRTMPRQIDANLGRLVAVGLLSAADHALLRRAALQSEDDYRAQLDDWIAGQSPEPR